VNRLAARIFSINFDANGPIGNVHEDAGEGNGVGSRIHDPGDVLSVPIQHQRALMALTGGRAPDPEPSDGERMALLRVGLLNTDWDGDRCAEPLEYCSKLHNSPYCATNGLHARVSMRYQPFRNLAQQVSQPAKGVRVAILVSHSDFRSRAFCSSATK